MTVMTFLSSSKLHEANADSPECFQNSYNILNCIWYQNLELSLNNFLKYVSHFQPRKHHFYQLYIKQYQRICKKKYDIFKLTSA